MAEREKAAQEYEALLARKAELEQTLAETAAPDRRPLWHWLVGSGTVITSLALVVLLLGGGRWGPVQRPPAAWPEPDQGALTQLVERRSGEFQACFTQWAATAEVARPGWAVLAELTVQADAAGRVHQVELRGESLPGALARCLEQRVRQWTFPRGGSFTFELPFAVEP